MAAVFHLLPATGLFGADRLAALYRVAIEDPAMLSDIIAHTFLRDPESRQAVFEELDVSARTRLLIRFLLGEMQEEENS